MVSIFITLLNMFQSLPFIFLDSLVYASWLFLVASGLTLIYGVMKVLNIAHGSLYAFGAYSMAWLVGWFSSNYESNEFLYFLFIPLSAILVAIILSLFIEKILKLLMFQINPNLLINRYC